MEATQDTITVSQFVANWKDEFIARIKKEVKSKKQNFNFVDAMERSQDLRTGYDAIMIEYLSFIRSRPLEKNDYYKYVNSYKKGKELDEKYFRHDVSKLHDYYKKSDKDPKYNPFSKPKFEAYVLYMMLKFSDYYKPEFDDIFKVKIVGSRQYNPLTSIPSVLRALLPFEIKEYDISQAYPSFIFLELNLKPFDVYSLIDKRTFNTLMNVHTEIKNATIEAVRSKLEPIYKDRVNEVITDHRFNNKGQLFEDLAKYEAEFIKKFVEANKPKYFVRLHDGVVTLADAECEILEFGNVRFKVKEFTNPELKNEIVTFYRYDENNKAFTNPVLYSNFFIQEDFIRITREGHDQLTILKNDNKIVSPINHKTDIVPYLKANINEFDTSEVENLIARDATNVIQQGFQLLTPIPLQYHKDTKTTCDIPFKNGIARIKADSMELIPYDGIDGFFTKHSTQQHEIRFKDVDDYQSDFTLFLSMAVINKDLKNELITSEDEKTISAFCSMFGYLITNYKNPAFNPAVILSDDDADGETRNGGRGKSLFQMALSYFRHSIQKGGKAYDPNYTHVHADLKQEHDLYLIDDVPSSFDYNALYTHITGSVDCQRKGVTAETIEFEDAPKFVISTNWAVRYDANATSTNRRFKEYKFSKFWNINNTPDQYLGKSFFSEWNADEWNAFYNFGFYCVQHYLIYGLETIEYDKKADNFRTYFYNDAILEETERVFKMLEHQDSFSVTDFVNFHQMSEAFRFKQEFNIRNSKKYIDAFIEFNKMPYLFSQRVRRWEKVEN